MNKNCRVCSEHFEPIMFLNDLKNWLKPMAVPMLVNVPNPPTTVTPVRQSPRKRRLQSTSTTTASSKKSRSSAGQEEPSTSTRGIDGELLYCCL